VARGLNAPMICYTYEKANGSDRVGMASDLYTGARQTR
jgi:hypothetical protein